MAKAAYRRLRVRFFVGGATRPAAQKLKTSFVAFIIAVVDWRLTCPAARPRNEPAAALAPLSHMLMNGFFFSQGLAISMLLGQRSHDAAGDALRYATASSAARR